ncbi:hypothetical protein HDK90DRAFT_61730 [Phyllosticta capitalensis]|uniref:Secreted protein n=1 Tax=Phyllosticta capitalensis TaxID=121624 RepID=A0ABR1YEY5_9PEZI
MCLLLGAWEWIGLGLLGVAHFGSGSVLDGYWCLLECPCWGPVPREHHAAQTTTSSSVSPPRPPAPSRRDLLSSPPITPRSTTRRQQNCSSYARSDSGQSSAPHIAISTASSSWKPFQSPAPPSLSCGTC